MALIWAAGIIWVAYDIAESAPKSSATTDATATDVTGAPVTPQDEKKFAEIINGL